MRLLFYRSGDTVRLLHFFCFESLQSIISRCILLFVVVFNNEGHLFL